MLLAATSLNNACLLRGRYRAEARLAERLAESHASNDIDSDSNTPFADALMVDEVSLLRLRLLVALTIVGGPAERQLPPLEPPRQDCELAMLLPHAGRPPLGAPWDRLCLDSTASAHAAVSLPPALQAALAGLDAWAGEGAGAGAALSVGRSRVHEVRLFFVKRELWRDGEMGRIGPTMGRVCDSERGGQATERALKHEKECKRGEHERLSDRARGSRQKTSAI